MKVVMISDFFDENLEYQENLVSETCIKQGHDVTFVTSTFRSVFDYLTDRHDATAAPSTYVAKGIKVVRLRYRWNVMNKIRRFTPIDGILDSEKPDLIYAHDITLNFPEAVRHLRRNPSCRMIMDYHADRTNSGKNWLSRTILHGVIRRHYLSQARRYLSKIFPVVPGGMDFLREHYGVRDSEMELLPLAIDMTSARRIREEKQGCNLRATLGISEGDIVVFTGGKFTPLKRTELAITAISKLAHLPIHLIVIGEGEKSYPDYSAKVFATGQGLPNVHYVGWQDREGVFKCLDAADFAVFPASQSVLWQQAIGMGLPLVVGDLGGQDPSYLNAHDNMVILSPDEITAERISEEISRLAVDASLRERMSRGADLVADEYLDWDKVIQKVLRFVEIPAASPGGVLTPSASKAN